MEQEIRALFRERYGREAALIAEAPGRAEIIGNHTDHQRGRAVAAAVDLADTAAAAPREDGVIRLFSQGYGESCVKLDEPDPRSEERNTSAALLRGVAARLKARGFRVGGFDAYAVSGVPGGSGLSSSAAFEVLVGEILSGLFCGGAIPPLEIAGAGRYAENVYFGKPCGLMDQTASAVGGMVLMDFADPERPAVRPLRCDFAKSGLSLCILDVGADHGEMTAAYAAIPREMGEVAGYFGRGALRDVSEGELWEAAPALRRRFGDRAFLRAAHFFAEDRRAAQAADALEREDFGTFLRLVRDSGRSSFECLQNIIPAGRARHQEMAFALALCGRLLGEEGAFRVHGGGFAGTAEAFVPREKLEGFRSGAEKALGKGSCRVLSVRPSGGGSMMIGR